MSGLKARVLQTNHIRVKQVGIGSSDLSTKNLSELADVNVTESDDGLLQYDADTDTWISSNTLDGGTF